MNILISGTLISSEAEVAKTLEYIKTRFPNFTEHGMQHSLRIINYIYCIMSEELKQDISDVEIFCFIMAAFFHDMGMILTDIDDKDEQRRNHHLYAAEPIKLFFDKYIQVLVEKRRLGKYLIQPGSFPDYREIIKSSKEELYQRILQGKEEASLCLERMNAGDWCSDYRIYENWKKDFQDYLKLLYSDLWYENGDIKED